MPLRTSCFAGVMLFALSVLGAAHGADESPSVAENSVHGEFVGSSPCDEAIRSLLGIGTDAKAELMQWKLTLHQNAKTRAPAGYRLRCDYGPTTAGKPGLGSTSGTVERNGSWRIAKGTKSNPNAVVYELTGAISLFKVDRNLLHVLNRDRSLMSGNGGWSYTLNQVGATEKPGDPSQTMDMSYSIAPVATGPSVSGVFEGRTPCHGIARALGQEPHAGCTKAKWRVTLYGSPDSGTPTTYKVEGTLFRQGPREGKWSLVRGADHDRQANVYRLAPTQTQAALFLLRGDDNVLFFLDQNRKPLVGHAEFSYTLNRREVPAAASSAKPIE